MNVRIDREWIRETTNLNCGELLSEQLGKLNLCDHEMHCMLFRLDFRGMSVILKMKREKEEREVLFHLFLELWKKCRERKMWEGVVLNRTMMRIYRGGKYAVCR